MKNAIYPLFPYPLMVCAELYEFTSAEGTGTVGYPGISCWGGPHSIAAEGYL